MKSQLPRWKQLRRNKVYGPQTPIHLTARAVEWLQRERFGSRGQKYEAPLGTPACFVTEVYRDLPEIPYIESRIALRRVAGNVENKAAEFCGVEDVRAMVAGWRFAYFSKKWDESFAMPIISPTCPHCSVLLDQLLEQTRQTKGDTVEPCESAREKRV